jgi:hypothetical protein
MDRTHEFAKDMCRILNEKTGSTYKWDPDWKPGNKGHESVDVVGIPNRSAGTRILIEAELRHDAPLRNVVKIWKWVDKKKMMGRFVLVQAFSKYYGNGDSKRENSEFVGEQMAEALGCRYVHLSFDYNPYRHGKIGAGRRRGHAHKLARKICRRLHIAY